MQSPPLRQPRWNRLAPWLLAVVPLACAPEEPVEPDDRVAVKITLDPVACFDGAPSQRKIVERIKNETRSIFPALRRADILLLSNIQVDVENAQLRKEQITAVDPVSGVARPATRVRFHYVALAQVPRSLAERTGMDLAVLHSPDGSHAEAILAACSANGDRERQAASEPWTVFDASHPGCAEAVAREEAAVAAARKKLAHPEREIVPAEIDRVYLPLVVHLRRRVAPDAGAARPASQGGGRSKGAAGPAAPGPAPDDAPDFVIIGREDGEQEGQPGDREDEKELRKQARALGGDAFGPTTAPPSFGSSPYLAPNYAVLYLAIIAFVVLLVGQTRRRSKK